MLGKICRVTCRNHLEINDYFLKTLQEQYPNDAPICWDRHGIIDESNGRRVRMAAGWRLL
ncbi:hypothetical protein ACNKHW_21725 [Shigella flexneri]